MWSIINSSFNVVFDVLLWPVQGLSPGWQSCAVGLPAAVFALLVFRYTSDQEGIEAAKDKIKAHLLELRLYRDDLRVTLRAQGRILRYNLTYLRHALVPMAVMIVPFVLMVVQLESRFAFRSLAPGESVLLTVGIDGEGPVSALSAELDLPDALVQDTPALRIDETGEVVWRLSARRPGEYEVGIRIGDVQVARRVVVDGGGGRVSPAVYRSNDVRSLAYPVEAPLDHDVAVRAVELSYPRSRAEFLGLSSASWIFFGAAIVLGFALRGVFGVTF